MERNLITIFILSLLFVFITASIVYKQATLQANLLGDKKFMKEVTRLIVVIYFFLQNKKNPQVQLEGLL